MDYGQLFAAAMQRPSIADTMGQAKDLAQNISAYQMQQRTAPVIQALQQFASNYNAATTDDGRHSANTMANQVRANYLAGGGSGMDLPTNLWGADPSQGFQTAAGFQSPVTGYEGLGRKDTIGFQRQALLDALTRRVQEAGLTGIDPATGQKTWDRQYQEASLANRSSGGGSGYSATDIKNLNTADALNAYKGMIDDAWTKGGGWAGAVDAIPKIMADIQANKAYFTTGGINTDDVVDYVYELIGGFVKKNGQWIPASEANKDDKIDVNKMVNEST